GLARLLESLCELRAHQEINDTALDQRELFRNRRKGRHGGSYLSSSGPPVMGKWRLSLTISFSSLPTLKNGNRFAGTSTGWPVRGLRPEYGLYGRTVKLPKPRISMPSPRRSASVIASNTQLTTSSALALVRSDCRAASASMSSLFVISLRSRAGDTGGNGIAETIGITVF